MCTVCERVSFSTEGQYLYSHQFMKGGAVPMNNSKNGPERLICCSRWYCRSTEFGIGLKFRDVWQQGVHIIISGISVCLYANAESAVAFVSAEEQHSARIGLAPLPAMVLCYSIVANVSTHNSNVCLALYQASSIRRASAMRSLIA